MKSIRRILPGIFMPMDLRKGRPMGEKQKQLSKEFVREWLIANHFMGKEGQTVPEMTDEWVETISQRYIELYEKVIGEKFHPQSLSDEETYQRVLYSLGNFMDSQDLNRFLREFNAGLQISVFSRNVRSGLGNMCVTYSPHLQAEKTISVNSPSPSIRLWSQPSSIC